MTGCLNPGEGGGRGQGLQNRDVHEMLMASTLTFYGYFFQV